VISYDSPHGAGVTAPVPIHVITIQVLRELPKSMTARKERLTVTVDPDLIEAGNQAVAAGRAESLSGWVNAALVDRAIRDRRDQSLSDAITAYETDHGQITAEEMAVQARRDREKAVVVRGPRRTSKPPAGRARRGAT
jgi:hypothetical protein